MTRSEESIFTEVRPIVVEFIEQLKSEHDLASHEIALLLHLISNAYMELSLQHADIHEDAIKMIISNVHDEIISVQPTTTLTEQLITHSTRLGFSLNMLDSLLKSIKTPGDE